MRRRVGGGSLNCSSSTLLNLQDYLRISPRRPSTRHGDPRRPPWLHGSMAPRPAFHASCWARAVRVQHQHRSLPINAGTMVIGAGSLPRNSTRATATLLVTAGTDAWTTEKLLQNGENGMGFQKWPRADQPRARILWPGVDNMGKSGSLARWRRRHAPPGTGGNLKANVSQIML